MRESFFDLVFSVIKESSEMGVSHLITGSNGFTKSNVEIKGKNCLNYSLCDYFGLSQNEKVKRSASEAVLKYGVYTAVSKTYIKLNIYDEAEELISKVFERPCLLFPRTTLAHIGVLPILIGSDDAIILDHQVHTSVRLAADLLKGYGNYCETIRHSRIDILEDRIKELSLKYKKVWYLCDGIYSIYGDVLPCNELTELLNQYEQFHLYIDDAHGMSWNGKNGCGFALSRMDYHPHMVITTSLGKGFGAGGGVTVCYDEEIKNKLSACSPPLMFSSPVSPATLGAIIASAQIHLSDEIKEYQVKLNQRIDFFRSTAIELRLPIVDASQTPIFYIAAGIPNNSCEIIYELLKLGIFVNGGAYPSVPYNNSGIRIVLTTDHSLTDINNLLYSLKEAHDKMMDRNNLTVKKIMKFYKSADKSHISE